MSNFDTKLDGFIEKFAELKKKESEFKYINDSVGAEFASFLKEEGLPENFSLVDLMALTRRKALLK